MPSSASEKRASDAPPLRSEEAGRQRQEVQGGQEEVTRYTFVVQIHPDGLSTLENLSTHERVQVSDLATVGPQIERWLEGLTPATAPPTTEGEVGA
jgi:hypothetical protein